MKKKGGNFVTAKVSFELFKNVHFKVAINAYLQQQWKGDVVIFSYKSGDHSITNALACLTTTCLMFKTV